jgi:hypothetical protein
MVLKEGVRLSTRKIAKALNISSTTLRNHLPKSLGMSPSDVDGGTKDQTYGDGRKHATNTGKPCSLQLRPLVDWR